MKIDFSAPIVDLKGAPVLAADDKPATLESVCMQALMVKFKDEEPTADDKVKRFKLGLRICSTEQPVDVKADEITLLKDRVSKGYDNPVIVGRAFELLDV